MKNKKLNLNELKVKSFVTDFENEKKNTVKGGNGNTSGEVICCMAPSRRGGTQSWCACK